MRAFGQAGRVRIAINGTDGRGFRIDVVAVAVELPLAKETGAAAHCRNFEMIDFL